ncbi:hypothetical protein QBC33DRAFT_245962 [Phialemonium atrogriseum]|uniref:Small secreted protein n=1 Tax=Phialemonium atrogriseum TaxID=1093897 RepID=A0AAJ0BSJ4_9PEZI|nr:uncharacterized protein QBC33DRAFT_245962 [Phialemonium atrogriseum]KAK1763495.1 hypothetical protein QBC33DRAFT_245962 [Phialemonium atrogriseum]
MRFSLTLTTVFAALAVAAPTKVKRGVFTQQTYDDISISGGVAGNAESEALSVFSALDLTDLASADKADVDFLKSVNSICNDAETEVFNPAIKTATGEEKDALQRGKIKNKVLKLEATMIRLMIEQAQGKDVADKIAAEQKKLNNNISQDEEAAGKKSTFLSFDAATA